MRGVSGRLRASLGASGPLGDSLTKGELREEDLSNAFRPHLAARYELVKGVVINAAGDESDPQDLVLLDTAVLPTILGTHTTRAVPVEGVAGTVQIKSVATKASIESAVGNVASAKRLLHADQRFGVPASGAHKPGFWSTSATFFGGALFLSAGGDVATLADAYARSVMALPPRERCDAACIVDRVAVLWGDPSRGRGLHFAARGEQAEAPLSLFAGEDSLLLFYMTLVEHLRNWITPPFDWLAYVFGTRSAPTGLEFSYSYWYDEDSVPSWVADHESDR